MSCLCSATSRPHEDQEERKNNDKISNKLKKDMEKDSAVVKLLLLGPGESGKSTIFKQLHALFNNGYSEEERIKYREIVFNNLFIGMKKLVEESNRLYVEHRLDTRIAEENAAAKDALEKIGYHDEMTEKLADQLITLWNDPGIKVTWEHRFMFQIPYPMEYFMGKIAELHSPSYIPSIEDVLRCRVRTTGIVELEFAIESTKFMIIDVGGQRNERKKWIHCFDKVTAVIFVAAISEYDQKLYEDEKTNRLQESLDLFKEISNLSLFSHTSIILFLNKTDIFAEKIKKTPLNEYFPDYFGSSELGPSTNFIKEKFLSSAKSGKKVFIHLTCATDSELIRKVFLDVRDIVLNRALDVLE
jgi:GTPase SAR1 family protein